MSTVAAYSRTFEVRQSCPLVERCLHEPRLTRESAVPLIRLFTVAVAVSVLAAGCSSGDDTVAEPIDATTETTEPTATSEPAATPTTEPAGIAPTVDPSAATEAWIGLWDGAELLVSDPSAAEPAVLAVADQAVFEQLNTIYNPNVAGDVANSSRTFENNPVAEAQDDGTVVINDCMFETPKVGNATIWYSGLAEQVDGEWTVTSLALESEIGCVPSSIGSDAISGYEAYWDARVEFWDPADPSSPLVGQTMSGAHLELIQGLLADHAERGLALRGRAATHPEVIEVRSATEVAILDCSEQDPGRGLFDAESGDRLSDIPAVREGQLDLTSAVMVLEDGVWKVSDVQGQADVSCDMAPTPQALPTV